MAAWLSQILHVVCWLTLNFNLREEHSVPLLLIMLRWGCGALGSEAYLFALQAPASSFHSCTCIYSIYCDKLLHSIVNVFLIFLHPFPPVTPSFTLSILLLPLLIFLFLSLCIPPVATALYLKMISGLRRLGCDWSPVPGAAVYPLVAFVCLPFLCSSPAGTVLPLSATHCVPYWALEIAQWGVSGFWLGWICWGGQWLALTKKVN